MARTIFGTYLKLVLRASGIDQRTLAARCFYHPSVISRIVEGVRSPMKPDKLSRIVAAVSDDRDTQANLIVAYLLDQCPPEFRGEIEINNARGFSAGGPLQPPVEVAAPLATPSEQARSA